MTFVPPFCRPTACRMTCDWNITCIQLCHGGKVLFLSCQKETFSPVICWQARSCKSLNTQVYYIRPLHMKRTQFETNGKQTKLTHSVSLKICLVLLVALSVVIRLITGSLGSCKADITLASKWILTLSTKRIPHFSTIQFVWMFSR